jgi:hypothetical protein
MSQITSADTASYGAEEWSPPPPPATPPYAPKSAPTDVHTELDAVEQSVDSFAQAYGAQADGKAGIQKAMDWGRQAFNEGYGDDQFKNIGHTREALGDLRQRLGSGKISQADARDELAQIQSNFSTEAHRVSAAQANNAQIGQAVHGAGRVGVVTLAGLGATAASGGNVLVGFAAGAGAGSVYDAVTVADQGSSAIAPKLDGNQSIGGVAARSLKGEQVNAGDWMRGGFGTLTDSASGAFAGQGMLSSKAAQLGAQQVAAQSGTQASRLALGQAAAKANLLNTVAQTGTNYGIQTLGTAADPSLSTRQKQQQIGQNTLQTAVHLPTQLAFGAVSSHVGVSTQLENKLLDTGLQFGLDGTTNLAQTSLDNALGGEGLGLSQADIAAAAVQAAPGAVQNIAQRVPLRSQQAVLDHLGTMHPYSGAALGSVPAHADGSTAIVGPLMNLQLDGSSDSVTLLHASQEQRSTPALWQGGGRSVIESRIAGDTAINDPVHIYRTFYHPLTKQRMVLAMDLNRTPTVGLRDQAAMDSLMKQNGLTETTLPVKNLIDETPSNVLPQTSADAQALLILRAASGGGQLMGAARFTPLPASLEQSIDSRLASVGNAADPDRAFEQHPIESLRDGAPGIANASGWMQHFLQGSGTPKIMNTGQVAQAVPAWVGDMSNPLTPARQRSAKLDPQSVLALKIEAQLENGATQGHVEGYSPDKVYPMEGGWFNALGSAHLTAVYKGDWSVDANDGSVRFQGERRWLIQDRYNWATPEFNGSSKTATADGVPAVIVSLLPDSYQEAFKPEFPGWHQEITDGMFGHLQMLQGGAQPFWTFGLGAPEAVDERWMPAAHPVR